MVRYGNQRPTFETVGGYASTLGPVAVRMFNDYGVRFYPCQEYELGLFLARDRDREFAATTICISKPRQNGKSFAARHYAIWMAAVEGLNVLYTAHLGKTVRKMFKAIRDLIKATKELRQALKPGNDGIHGSAGSEGIYFSNGGMIEFATRTNGGGRGDTYDVIIIDEAQELTDEELDAVKPTTLASDSGDPQMIYIGTPPNAKCPGTVFRGLHDKAHKGEGGSTWWLEWAAKEIGDPMNVERWYECCPAMGYRIREKVMRAAAETATSPDSFAREYLGWWSDVSEAVERVIDKKMWSACEVERAPEGGSLAIGVKFSPGGATVAVSWALARRGGPSYVELSDVASTANGIQWLIDMLMRQRAETCAVVIDGKSGAENLRMRLVEAGYPKLAVTMADTATAQAAATMFVNEVAEGTLRHIASPALDVSVTGSVKRKIGREGFGFGDGPDAISAPAESATLALYGARTTKRDPSRKQRASF